MRAWIVCFLFALPLSGAVPTPAAAADPPALTVRALALKLSEGDRAADMIRLEAVFLPQLAQAGYDPEIHGVVVTIGSAVVTSLPPVDSRAALREKSPFVWDYRERRSRTRPGRRGVVIDFTTGVLRLTARGLDLSGLSEGLPGTMTVTLALGDTVYSARIEPTPKGRAWLFRGPDPEPPAAIPPRPAPPPMPGPDPSPDPVPPGTVSLRALASGPLGVPQTAQNLVARNATEYTALWAQCHPPGSGGPAAPAVDFSKEIVVAVFIGCRLTGGFEAVFLGAQASGDGARVDFEEQVPGANCFVPMAMTRPFAVAAITRVTGAVSFLGTVRTVNCP